MHSDLVRVSTLSVDIQNELKTTHFIPRVASGPSETEQLLR